MAVLKRRPKSGFVLFPNDAERRIIDGSARFRTRCDMLVGPCACGGVHQEHDEWVQDILRDNNHTIETLVLRPSFGRVVQIPRYWIKSAEHHDCNVLHGNCNCGLNHTANECWVTALLIEHDAVIEDCPAALDPPVGFTRTVPIVTDGECDCDSCQRERRHRHYNDLDRRNI